MPRRRDPIEDTDDINDDPLRAAAWVEALNLPPVPPRKINGNTNPEHFRVRMGNATAIAEAAMRKFGNIPFNIESMTKMIERDAEMEGFDPLSLKDARSDGDKIRDSVENLLESPNEIWATTDEDLTLIEKAVERVINEAAERINRYADPNSDLSTPERRRMRLGKTMLNRIRRVLRLREAARHPCPTKTWAIPKNRELAWHATHVLRFALYVSRSSTEIHRESTSGTSHVFMMGMPHVKFAVDTWVARQGVLFENGNVTVHGCRKKKGIIIIAPPGHGKSVFASHYLALEICLNPKTQSLYVHAVLEKAKEQKAYVGSLFERTNTAGRRAMSLFPLELAKRDNNSQKMRLKLPEQTKSPTITACGMGGGMLGADSNFQVFDDIVPQSDVDEPTERERRFRLLSGTFGTRQRGQNTFQIFIGTLWHHADALAQLWKLSDNTDLYFQSRLATGGPTPGVLPVFASVWPEVYPESELRRRFDQMKRNYALWSANYMGNPVSEETRIVRKLKYYDPEAPGHQDFLASAVFHISVDPTATNKESSDKAGLVYAAVGEIPVVRVQDGREIVGYQMRLRILSVNEIHANQVELADRVAQFAATRPVGEVHVETRSGFHATADIIENKFGIHCTRHDPANKDKEQRLKQCAGVIDAGLEGMDPLVEFPGELKTDGSIGQSDQWKGLYSQILNFGYSDEDHLVDALTQLVNHLLRVGVLVAGSAATQAAQLVLVNKGDPRIVRMLDEAARKPKRVEEENQADWAYVSEKEGFEWN